MLSQVDLGLWKKDQQMDAHKKALELCYRYKRRICAKERKDVSVVKRRERRGT